MYITDKAAQSRRLSVAQRKNMCPPKLKINNMEQVQQHLVQLTTIVNIFKGEVQIFVKRSPPNTVEYQTVCNVHEI